MLIRKSTNPRSIISITQPPRPAGVIAAATVNPIVVSCFGASILSAKMWHASASRPALKA